MEPTTGAPVDAVPRRVPVRQHREAQPAVPTTTDAGDGDGDGAFWLPIEEVHWDGTPIQPEPTRPRRVPALRALAVRWRRGTRSPHPPDPLPGLAAVLALSLLAAFFAWVSAGPLWLAVGHASGGTAVVGECTGGGLTQRCRGIFVADGGGFVAHGVRLSGVPAGQTGPGAALPARMTGPAGGTAYVGSGPDRHLRWLLGLLAVGGCAAGIARYGGATRLPDRQSRRWAVAVSLAGPLVITLGFLVAAW
ncbi:hypothetical protein AWW66_23040 [Micromonospora rosaria]|uniref:Uncharacterized protein n=1 Tax=Micromonospora rosaria TaxID=47874 RepID=A0A136PMX6_9ACTN|nr:hypothetical protein AWW66_23040 [Micromonospora rosaria]